MYTLYCYGNVFKENQTADAYTIYEVDSVIKMFNEVNMLINLLIPKRLKKNSNIFCMTRAKTYEVNVSNKLRALKISNLKQNTTSLNQRCTEIVENNCNTSLTTRHVSKRTPC